MIPPLRWFNEKGPDRVAIVSVTPVWGKAGALQVQVARGVSHRHLAKGTTFGPYTADEILARRDEVIATLRADGFVRAGVPSLRKELASSAPRRRAHAAIRAGWMREGDLVPALLDAAALVGTDISSVVEALGRVGDPRGLEACRGEADRKLLSRRRAGVEALRNLGDVTGLAAARARAIDRLPDALHDAVNHCDLDVDDADTVDDLEAVLTTVDKKDLGLTLDSLYELGGPVARALVLRTLQKVAIGQAHMWRYVKSIYKRAMARGDHETFARIYRQIEITGRKVAGTVAVVKSGLDGQQRQSRIFQRGTQHRMRRLAWKYLRRLAHWRPMEYALAAAEVLAAYQPSDREAATNLYDPWSRAYLFHRILSGGSSRGRWKPPSMRFRMMPAPKHPQQPEPARIEAFPAHWDAVPRAYVTLLAKSTVVEVLSWAVERAGDHPTLLHDVDHATVLKLLAAPFEPAVAMGLAELDRRFDADHPDWTLITALLADTRAFVREKAAVFLVRCAPSWTADLDKVMSFLGAQDAGVRIAVAGAVVMSLAESDVWMRRELAERVLATLQAPEVFPGSHEGYAQVARDGLAEELGAVLDLDEILSMVSKGSPAVQTVAGTLLGRRPDAMKVLGPEKVLAMAMHDVAAVRHAAQSLIRGATEAFEGDPSMLFALLDSEWADTRRFAFDLLRGPVDVAKLGIEGIVALCDSMRPDVQSFGREMALKHFDALESQDLIHRLSEHPAPRIRRFALDLVTGHLKGGFVALARLEGFFRRALLDLWPERREKRLVVEFLLQRGLKDERQADVATRVLSEFVRVKGRADFEMALDALVRLKLAFPELETVVAPRAHAEASS